MRAGFAQEAPGLVLCGVRARGAAVARVPCEGERSRGARGAEEVAEKELAAGVAGGAKGLPRPVGHHSRLAGRARGLPGLVCERADAAIGARIGRIPPLAHSLLAWAALDAFPEVVDPRNAAVAACWARSALRSVADSEVGGVLAGIAQ